MKQMLRGLILASAAFSSGCAARTSQVFFDSEPRGAVVQFNGRHLGQTPFTAHVSWSHETWYFTAKKDGYQTAEEAYPRDACPSRIVFSLDRDAAAENLTHGDRRRPEPSTLAVSEPGEGFDPPATATKIRQRWAVVIGVSDYRDHRIPPLGYAARDAETFYDWLTSADGGRYGPSNTRLLVGKQATAENIRDALFDWLAQALEEDLVTIYFSGHGTPESPDRPENLFLVPYDADYDRIAATAFPMWDIETALKRFIKARKVVVIADACHAGGVGSEFAGIRRAIGIQQAGLVSDGLQDLAQANDGVAVITSAGSKQLSQESEKWGGGHGVFTYYLLQGLKGQADYNSDSRVTIGELTLYVSEQVRRATKNAQSPEVAGKFDPALTIGR